MSKINTDKIPSGSGEEKRVKVEYNTDDIIDLIIKTDQENDNRFCQFSKQFPRNKQGLKKLWEFVRKEIKYKEDAAGTQLIKKPGALWRMKIGDCKSKTLFINQVLRCLNIPYIIRFTSYSENTDFTHVYTVALLDGKSIILDSVYHAFNREKPYINKSDYFYNMKGLYQISGTDNADIDIRQHLKNIKQLQKELPAQQFIPFSELTAGEAQLYILKRALEVKRVFKPELKSVWNEALSIVDAELAAVKRGTFHDKGFVKKGIYSDAMFPILQKIDHIKKRRHKAIQKPVFLRTERKEPRIAGTWINPNKYQRSDGTFLNLTPNPEMSIPNLLAAFSSGQNIPGLFDSQGNYIFGKNSQYRKTFSDLQQVYVDLVNQYITSPIMDGQNPILSPFNVAPAGFPEIYPPLSKIFTPSLQQWQYCAASLQTRIMNPDCNTLIFRTPELRTQFQYDMRAASGVLDEYMNDVFADVNQIGNGFIYSYIQDAGLSLNNVPQSVAAKYVAHASYISGASTFSGLDLQIIKDLGASNIRYTNGGEEPETILVGLQQQSQILAGQAAVGLDPVTLIGAIVAAIVSVVGAVEGIMRTAKQQSDLIDPTNLPDTMKPIGVPLMLSGSDWTDPTPPPTPNGNGGTSGNTGVAIALIGAGLLAYDSYKKS